MAGASVTDSDMVNGRLGRGQMCLLLARKQTIYYAMINRVLEFKHTFPSTQREPFLRIFMCFRPESESKFCASVRFLRPSEQRVVFILNNFCTLGLSACNPWVTEIFVY